MKVQAAYGYTEQATAEIRVQIVVMRCYVFGYVCQLKYASKGINYALGVVGYVWKDIIQHIKHGNADSPSTCCTTVTATKAYLLLYKMPANHTCHQSHFIA